MDEFQHTQTTKQIMERERDNGQQFISITDHENPSESEVKCNHNMQASVQLISWQTYWSRNKCHNDVKVDANRTFIEEWWWGINCLAELSPLIYLRKSCCISNQVELSPWHDYLP